MLDVQVATSFTADGLPTSYQPIDATGSIKNAATTTSVKVRFERFLLPSDTFRQSICVQPSLKPVTGIRNCTYAVFLEPTYDPVHREITFRQSADTSKARLLPATTYRVTLFPPASDGASGIQAFDGAPLAGVEVFTFTTSDVVPEGAKVEQIPTDDLFCGSVLTSLQGCAYGNCHYYPPAKDKTTPGAAEGLDLSAPSRIAATAIGHVAHETQEGEHAREGDRTSLRFGRAMPLIDPGFPGNSYLLYKLLANPANTRSLPDPPSEAEITRLRASVVVGMPMPPSNAFSADIKDAASLDALSNWILQGAPITSCP